MSRGQDGYQETTRLLYRAAVGLAAAHFPITHNGGTTVTSGRDVSYLLDGHVDAWPGWSALPEPQALQIARLLRLRPVEYANHDLVEKDLRVLLAQGELPGCTLAGEDDNGLLVGCASGMPLATYIDTTLDELESRSSVGRGTTPTASPGSYQTTVRVDINGSTARALEARYVLPPYATSAPEAKTAPTVAAAEPMPQINIPVFELVELAAKIDQLRDRSGGYRARHVEKLCRRIRSRDGSLSLSDAFALAAGSVRLLNAPTGLGKSVLMEVLACWAALHGVVVTLVVPTNADCLKLVRAIEEDLEVLASDATVTPLISPNSLFNVLNNVMRTRPWWDPHGEWTLRRLGYGCALTAAATTDTPVDTWQPGDEPCTRLQPAQSTSGTAGTKRRRACPWRMTCGKFQLARASTVASVIVTSHTNLHLGRLHLPVRDERGVTDRMSVEELVFRRSHLVVIDEIDAFQSDVLAQSARGLLLDHFNRNTTPLRALDTEFGAAAGRVQRDVEAAARDQMMYARFLAETYTSSLARGRIGPVQMSLTRRRGPARRWIVARRWDGYLTAKLFQLEERESPGRDQVNAFRSLFPNESPKPDDEPELFGRLRPVLHEVTRLGGGARVIETSRDQLHTLLEVVEPDETERAKVIDRLLRRAILERLRQQLHKFVFQVPYLVAADVQTAREIAETFGPYSRWRVTPNGPLGRLLFAFTEYYDSKDPDATRLRAAAFGGDPHIYITGLGDITALCRSGTRRAVLGLSATAYFPQAPHHHIHTDPHWWVGDSDPGGVQILAAPLTTADQKLVRISGKEGHERVQALQMLARLLWERKLKTELQRLAAEEPERARVLLATTSYAGARAVAEGLAAAGVDPRRICLAVRPTDTPAIGETDLVDPNRSHWSELPADRLEEFPTINGADLLIAPLARVQRGINIIGAGDQSALGSIWLIVRPIPLIEEPNELIAHVNAHVLLQDPIYERIAQLVQPRPADVLRNRRRDGGDYFEQIVTSLPYFRTMPKGVQLAITAEIMNGIIQLVGRARRGGTPAVIHLADGAFLDPDSGPTFASLIARLRDHWRQLEALDRMHELYGTTLEAFFTYADTQLQLLDET